MFSHTLLPRVIFLRTVVIAFVFTTVVNGGLSFFIGVNTKAAPGLGFFNYNLAVTAAPANDNYANALPLLGVSGVVFGTNVGATKELNEQTIAGINGIGSVWYRWQAPTTGRYVFTTVKSEFNTLLAVYTGSNVQGSQVIANDDGGLCFFEMTRSKVAFNATAGVIYHIAVDGKSSSGNITLRWGRSATITVRPTTVSNTPPSGALGSDLNGDTCEGGLFVFSYSDVPTGGSYTVSIRKDPGTDFGPANDNPDTSPLTGDVTLTYYLRQPAFTIFGRITNLTSADITGLTVMCVSINGGLVSIPANKAFSTPWVTFNCPGLPANAQYLVTPSKVGYTFQPATTTVQLFGNFDIGLINAIPTSQTIAGRVTLTGSLTGVSGVTVSISGSQTASRVTDTVGNYSFTVPHGGNYNLTPSHPNFTFAPSNLSFTNVTTTQTANFSALFSLQLILDESGPVAALDSVLHTRDPFPVINSANLINQGVDRNTRVAIFVSNFQLGPGELPSSVVINLVGSNTQSFDIPAEDVRPTSHPEITQVIFRLPNTLTPGICTLLVKARGMSSNIGAMRIRV